MAKPRGVEVHGETPQEAARYKWFEEQALKSPDTLEAAARTILGLVTGLLGLLFGVLAVTGDPLPSYFNTPAVRWLGTGTVVALMCALIGALGVLFPGEIVVPGARPDRQAEAFHELLSRKSRRLKATVIAFCIGLAALSAVLVMALLTVR